MLGEGPCPPKFWAWPLPRRAPSGLSPWMGKVWVFFWRLTSCTPATASMNVALYAGIAGGVVAALLILGIIIYCCCFRSQDRDKDTQDARP